MNISHFINTLSFSQIDKFCDIVKSIQSSVLNNFIESYHLKIQIQGIQLHPIVLNLLDLHILKDLMHYSEFTQLINKLNSKYSFLVYFIYFRIGVYKKVN